MRQLKLTFSLFLVMFFVHFGVNAQVPNISYAGSPYSFPTGTAITPLVPTNSGGTVTASTTTTTVSTIASGNEIYYGDPLGVALDAAGNLYVALKHRIDWQVTQQNKILKITSAGAISILAGSGRPGSNDATGTAASFFNPSGVALDASGNVYVGDQYNNKIRKITPAGVVSTFAGGFNHPYGVAVDAAGTIYVADHFNHKIRKITSAGVVSTFAGSGTRGSTDGTGTAASFAYPTGVDVDAAGNVYVADDYSYKIRKITSAGVVSTFAGGINHPQDVAVDAFGAIYVTENSQILKVSLHGYSISPALPTGLSFDATTGGISGTPTKGTPATNYTIIATNGAGSSSVVISMETVFPCAIALTPASQTNISTCFGDNSGAASVNTPTGGIGPYSYNWAPGNPTGNGTTSVTGLTAGTYTCTVTDSNNCTDTQSFTITQPSAIPLTPASQTNISTCFGDNSGAASVNIPTGATGPYTYNWSPGNPAGDGTTSVTGLTAGTWTCTVTDANSCTASQNFTITQPSKLIITHTSQTNVSFNGVDDGSASVLNVSGGVPGYTYSWAPTGGTAATATGLTSGTYTVTITDAGGCTLTKNFIINVNSIPTVNVLSSGLICQPAGGVGPTPLNPNGDGWSSISSSGYSTDVILVNEIPNSEIPYKALPVPYRELASDLTLGNCGYSDIVSSNNSESGVYMYSDGTNLLFRFRQGNTLNTSRGFSILIDTDGKIGNTGPNADPNFIQKTNDTNGNPGFEIEIVLETNWQVAMYDVDGTDNPFVLMRAYPISLHQQRSVELTNSCNDPDYFIDFYIVLADLYSDFGITSSTPLRYAATSVLEPRPAIGGLISDINGGDTYEEIINYQCGTPIGAGPTTEAPCSCTNPPTINGPITSGTNVTISGDWIATSPEKPQNATIEVFVNGVSSNTTVTTSGSGWSMIVTGPLVNGDIIYATAVATGEGVCDPNPQMEIVNDCNSGNTPVEPVITCIGNKGITGYADPNSTIIIYRFLAPPASQTENLVAKITADGTGVWGWDGILPANNTFGGICTSGTGDMLEGTYKVSQLNNALCPSPLSSICLDRSGGGYPLNGSSVAPVIITEPIVSSVGIIQGTALTGDIIRLYINGQLRGTQVTADGNYSFSGISPLPAGALVAVTAQGDLKCESVTATKIVSCSVSAPFISNANNSNQIEAGNIIIGLSEVNGATINIYDLSAPTVSLGTAVVSGGTWSSSVIATNGVTYFATVTSACGTSSASPYVTALNPSTNRCGAFTNAPYDVNTVAISGTLSSSAPNVLISLYIDGVFIISQVTSSTAWSIPVTSNDLYGGGIVTIGIKEPGLLEFRCSVTEVINCTLPPLDISPLDLTIYSGDIANFTISNPVPGLLYAIERINPPYYDTGVSIFSNGSNFDIAPNTINSCKSETFNFQIKATDFNGCEVTKLISLTVNPRINCIASTTWNGSSWSSGSPDCSTTAIFNGNYNGSGFDACSVQVNTGSTVIINSGVITVTNEINIADDYSFIVENGVNLVQINDVVNTGKAIVKRNSAPIIRLDYTAWSSPVLNQNLLDFSNETLQNRFYTYNPSGTTTPTAWISVTNPSTTDFNIGNGYLIRSPNNWSSVTESEYLGEFKGVLNNGTISVPVTTGYNLIGNPYASALKVSDFISGNSALGIGTLYFWTHTVSANSGIYPQNNYASRNNLGGTAAVAGGEIPDEYIQVGQGFLTNTPIDGNIIFQNNMRSSLSNNQFFRTSPNTTSDLNEAHRIWLNLSDTNNNYNQILVGYIDNATNAYDEGFDGKLLNNANTHLYSIIDSERYVIQGRANPFNQNDEVLLGFKTDISGNFTIAMDRFDGLFSSSQDIYLKDNQTSIVHNLKESSYSFNSINGEFINRFSIVFKDSSLSNENSNQISSLIVYIDNKNLININNNNNNNNSLMINKVEIFDITGRLLFTKDKLSTNHFSINNDYQKNVLIIKTTLENGLISTEKIIN
ncbi:T9SS sorting signal type C domain-containing protein [Flavobacterium sp.]|jgi:hypothetical protein|uniref:T9SS sorting signal type C domain-containing protein n=1 Tax=Flavobacterium sp. TaxID=239 RepID=UPI002A816EAF|nr:T9SS sorting signal type C domain-containing protein [Flavobacterium sp.]